MNKYICTEVAEAFVKFFNESGLGVAKDLSEYRNSAISRGLLGEGPGKERDHLGYVTLDVADHAVKKLEDGGIVMPFTGFYSEHGFTRVEKDNNTYIPGHVTFAYRNNKRGISHGVYVQSLETGRYTVSFHHIEIKKF